VLLRDAIRTMTPRRGAGPNAVSHDARLLYKQLIAALNRQLDLVEGIYAYESKLLKPSSNH
jgi:hypothetical protein